MDKIVGFLESLATKLGTTVEALWPNAVRHVAIEGLSSVIASALILVVILVILFAYRKQPWIVNWAKEGHSQDNGPSARSILTGVAGVLTLVTVFNSCDNMAKVLEPEGHLVRQILRK